MDVLLRAQNAALILGLILDQLQVSVLVSIC